MFFPLLLISFVVGFFIYQLIKPKPQSKFKKEPPTFTVWDAITGRLPVKSFVDPDILINFVLEHGPVVRLNLLGKQIYLLSRTDMMKPVVMGKSSQNVTKPKELVDARGKFEKALFYMEGEEWSERRSIMKDAFTENVLKDRFPVVQHQILDLMDAWKKKINQSSTKQEIDVEKDVSRLTLRTIVAAGFGHSVAQHDEPFDDKRPLESMNTDSLLGILHVQFWTHAFRAFTPKTVHPIINFFERNIMHSWKTFLYAVASQRHEGTLLALLQDAVTKDGKSLTQDQIISEVHVACAAGSDPTHTAISWSLVEMAKDHSLQERVRDEINTLPWNKDNTLDSLDPSQIPYTNALFQEIIRYHDTVGLSIHRYAKEDVELRDGYGIPKGATALLLVGAAGHREWDDPKQFRPERWLETKKQTLSFGMGPRRCLGEKLARLEVLAAIAHTLRRYRVFIDPEHAKTLRNVMHMSIVPEGPVNIKFESIPSMEAKAA